MARVAVIGAGAMGLAAAYHALKAGHAVEVFEADSVPGGMAAHFDLGGTSIERFYHFVCKADRPTFDLLDELGIGGSMRWRPTSMGYFIDGGHHPWGDPLSLLRFPHLSLAAKVRYGLQMFLATRRTDWLPLEKMRAKDWIVGGAGAEAYDVLWRRLFDLKFYEYADNVSAAWIWSRIKRLGNSRRSILQEELGYIEGGSETLVSALVRAIEARGGRIHLGRRVSEIASQGETVAGVRIDGDVMPFDNVIATVPTPLISKLVPALPSQAKQAYDAICNIGVVCVVMRLAKPISRHFWININDPRIEIPGIIEFSNLRPLPNPTVYVPYYMPPTHPKFARNNAAFVDETYGYLKLLNPSLTDRDLIASHVGRLQHAQPVCEPGFLSKIPPVQTPIRGLQVADTCYYYPEDRGISESVRYGKLMAAAIGPELAPR
jgi:protoporphyrinogen oxidase